MPIGLVRTGKSFFSVMCLFFLLASSSSLHAQQKLLSLSEDQAVVEGASEDVLLDSPEAVRELVSRLSDSDVRRLLLQQLDAVAATKLEASTETQQSIFSLVTTSVPAGVSQALMLFPEMLSFQKRSFLAFTNSLIHRGVPGLVVGFLMAIAFGLIVEFLVRRLLVDYRAVVDKISADKFSLKQTLKVLGLRLVLDMSGLIVFIVITQIAIRQSIEPAGHYVAHQFLWNLVLIPRLFSVALKFVVAPNRSDLRLMNTTDVSAQFLHRHLVCVAWLIGLTLTISDLNRSMGIQIGEAKLGFWFNLAIHGYFGFIAWRSRTTLVDILHGKDNDTTPLEEKVARWYPYYAMVVITCSWILVEVLVAQGELKKIGNGVQYSTMFILLLAPVLDTVIRGLVRHLTPAIIGEGAIALKAYNATKRCYIRMSRVVASLFIIYFISSIWGIDASSFESTNIGAQFFVNLLEFIVIVATGYMIWELTTLWLNTKLAMERIASGESDSEQGAEGGTGRSRLSTVLPLIIWFVQTIIVVMTVLIGLGNLGIDTTPLLAGAGIVGLAIGFGAQKLVSDIVSGLFFLIDDAFRSGEYVNIEGTVGTVERISLRAMQLRHHRGAVHTIPYGEIPKITNYSRDWTIMKLTFTVPFETDLKKVKDIFKKIGKDLLEIPEFADDFIQPFKSQGVIEVDDIGIVVRGKFMVKPGRQFMIRKEIFNRVQQDFEASGIQFARKEVRVRLDKSSNETATDEDMKAAGAAASEVSTAKPAS